MQKFISKYSEGIRGTIRGFDRVLFKGHLPISGAGGMAAFLRRRGVLFKDFRKFVKGPADRLKRHAQQVARSQGRPYEYVSSARVRKEERAREIAERDGIREGLVCVLSAMEGCLSFRWQYGPKGAGLIGTRRKCLCLYFYWIDPELGLLHVRVQTWLPFTIQICVNGREWLSRRLEQEGVKYVRQENCVVDVDDFERAQELADEFVRLPWVNLLAGLADRANPLLKEELAGMAYYWVCDQAEYATDVVFDHPSRLEPLYEKLLEHSLLRLGARDLLSFLDKCADGRFRSRQFNVGYRRQKGARVRHWVKHNWIKMYNKLGVVVRVETVINHPYDFLIFRSGIRKGQSVRAWFPMSKNVGNLYRYAQVAAQANSRYLTALAVQDDPRPAQRELEELTGSVPQGQRRLGGFNPARSQDRRLFAEITRGEYLVRGFRNADLRTALFDSSAASHARRHAARVTRLLQKLHHRRLIKKIPRSRRWRITEKGNRILGALLAFFQEDYLALSAPSP